VTGYIGRDAAEEGLTPPGSGSLYQLIPSVPIGSTMVAEPETLAESGAALAEALLPATMARTARGRRTTRRKREKRRMVMKLLA
jgi:hypothetical protein